MLYAIFIYGPEGEVASWNEQQHAAVVTEHTVLREKLTAQGKAGPVVRLMPTTTAVTVRKGNDPVVIDGPFAETKEQLLGLYTVDCDTLDEAIEIAKAMPWGTFEIRPVFRFFPGAALPEQA
ncbi:MAG TPA: YciI family protein [Vineibacter sp.]|nr:YciI family protein [Vineibacter sp.]